MSINIQEDRPSLAIKELGILGEWSGSPSIGYRLSESFTEKHLQALLAMGYVGQDEDLLPLTGVSRDPLEPKHLEAYYLQAPENADSCFLIFRINEGWFIID